MGLRSRHYRVLISTLPLTVKIKYDSSDKTLRITLDTNKISFFFCLSEHIKIWAVFPVP